MEEEKAKRVYSSLRSFSGFRDLFCNVFFKNYRKLLPSRNVLAKGLTLVELLVVIGILSVLVAVSMAAIDPLAQLNKGKDAKRLQDITQLNSALDAYFSDKNVYPATFPFGSQFSVPAGCILGANGCTIYMKSTPSDPNIIYMSDGGAWAVLFAKETATTQDCSLTALNSCLPVNYSSNWFCKVLGTPDCNSIKNKTLQ